jgi:uncharacterized flavoprotein (TIGR03862 family)
MLGCCLDPDKFTVSIYEKNAAPGRKFLVAGDGGLNLTHSEPPAEFITRYTPRGFLDKAFSAFNNTDLVNWFSDLGIQTFVGTSKRVFPLRTIKPIQVLNAMLEKLAANNVRIFTRHEWKGFRECGLLFDHPGELINVDPEIVIFSLGGASWPVTGSTGDWLHYFSDKGIAVKPFQASNCAVTVSWNEAFISKFAGSALKNIAFSCGDRINRGEVVLTRSGLEGSGVYPLSPSMRSELAINGVANLYIDMKPSLTHAAIVKKLSSKNGNVTARLRSVLNLTDAQVALIKHSVSRDKFVDMNALATAIKHFRIEVKGLGALEDAISTVGGISLEEIDDNFELKKMPGCYCIGEMLDYDAPTGGYLLQSCFSMAGYLSTVLNG